jgi:hypothetical protein
MNPAIWGRSFWVVLLYIVNNYYTSECDVDFSQIHKLKRFLLSVGYVLPCKESCRPNFIKNLERFPLEEYIHSAKSLSMWLYNINSAILSEKGLESISYDVFITKYKVSAIDFQSNVVFTVNNIAQDYPREPMIDDIFQYKNFFTYLAALFIVDNYNTSTIKYVPIDPYLNSRSLLQGYIHKMFTYRDTSKFNTLENFTNANTGVNVLLIFTGVCLGGLCIYHISKSLFLPKSLFAKKSVPKKGHV